MYYTDPWFIIVFVLMLVGLGVQAHVKSVYREYSKVAVRRGGPASAMVDDLLRRNGNSNVTVQAIGGELSDHYNPASETLSLSQGVYGSASIAAYGIAAHEAGHAMQKFDHYGPLALRTALVPVVQIGSQAAMPIFFAGLIFSWRPLLTIGILAFALSTVFAFVTLPVELDASARAVRMLREGGYLEGDELAGAQKVLRAAAWTYVVAALSSLANLLRLIMISRRRDD